MMIEQASLDDKAFIEQFECQTLAPVYFNHIGHIRVTCIYLCMYDFVTARNRVCHGIKAYAESLGAKGKFNITMTNAVVTLIATRLEACNDKSWQSVIANNQDIVLDTPGVLRQYFTPEVLFSERAKVQVMEPDIKPIECL
ncbi:hypothetical protein J8L98_07525 [Pseudoalteromonas sp. MMG013]|uniref:hypothetical protein n=1 Tax=Pseudoalteromonas sp. MMG013 TaxID=2822687 RepID=UPI001B37A3AC|nr:hypothetical protein [Pseudoalteromonas sp. MMG013]MBQ4861538.1 hypothetical protein [Pseudoalteromonas sp. MMG013]